MLRFAMGSLVKWKKQKNRKPMIIMGARQVGKTWLMKELKQEWMVNIPLYAVCNL